MWADTQCDGCPAEYRWCTLRQFHNSILCSTLQIVAHARSSSAVQYCCQYGRTQDMGHKVNFASGKIPSGSKRAPENVQIVYQPRRRPNAMQGLVGLQ